MIKICTVITGKTLEEFLQNLEKTQRISDCIELRVDSIENLQLSDIKTIRKSIIKESIFTCRRKNEGGNFQEEEKKRLEILSLAYQLNFNYVDVELSSATGFNFKQEGRSKIILSYHDFRKTPSYLELQQVIQQMKQYQAYIFKIATYINNENDIKTLSKILIDKEDNDTMVVIGMGEKGKMTRIFFPLIGSYLTFASTPFFKTAPGQINIETLKNIYKELGNI